jgi:hypothetical protein
MKKADECDVNSNKFSAKVKSHSKISKNSKGISKKSVGPQPIQKEF